MWWTCLCHRVNTLSSVSLVSLRALLFSKHTLWLSCTNGNTVAYFRLCFWLQDAWYSWSKYLSGHSSWAHSLRFQSGTACTHSMQLVSVSLSLGILDSFCCSSQIYYPFMNNSTVTSHLVDISWGYRKSGIAPVSWVLMALSCLYQIPIQCPPVYQPVSFHPIDRHPLALSML